MDRKLLTIQKLYEKNEKFIKQLRKNIYIFYPLTSSQNINYPSNDFYLIIYRTFMAFGWRITTKKLIKIFSPNPPFDLAEHILKSLIILNEKYFSHLFMLILCKNIFNYGFKPNINLDIFISWIKTQNYISDYEFFNYKWKITQTYLRNNIEEKFTTKFTDITTPKWKKCIIDTSVESYLNLLNKMKNYPEIQVVSPVLTWGKNLIDVLEKKEYQYFKKISVTYKKEMYQFNKDSWWVDFANKKLGGGALTTGFVQEEILAMKFPEILYFSNQGYKIPHQGAILMTNLLKSINFPDLWYGRKNISKKSCWDIISGIEKENNIELKNFIAIAAVNHSDSSQRPFVDYTKTELVTVFNRCYSGFMMAKILGAQIINSGPLGTGNFNNSPIIMYTLQILAASAAGIDISFWGTDSEKLVSLKKAIKIIEDKEVLNLIPSFPFRGLLNIGSSCYMDSVLFSMLYRFNPVFQEQILEKNVKQPIKDIQNELIDIQRSIQGGQEIVETCTDFRQLLRNIPEGKVFSRKNEQDAGEFFIFLMELFNVKGSIIEYKVYGTNDIYENPNLTVTSEYIDNNSSLINFIDSFTIVDVPENYMLSNFLKKTTDTRPEPPYKTDSGQQFIRKITIEEVLNVPYFYSFYLQRPDPITQKVLTKNIHPNEAINFAKNGENVLELYSIIIHQGNINSGHYLVYFKYNNLWWKYNDLNRKIRKIGSFHQMINYNPSPTSYGILYFYGKLIN